LLNVASFENFNLGANSTLIKHNLTNVATRIRAAGAMTLAMVSSYPYPPEFLTWMRQVFADPQPFIDACIAAAADEQLSGFNVRRAKFSPPFTRNNSSSYLHPSLPIPLPCQIDWEPPSSDKPTPADAAAYASFLDTLAKALHAHGLLVTVDVATWSKIWDLKAIAATSVDAIFTMNTYGDDDVVWARELALVIADIPASKLVVGLETTMSSTGKPYNTSELTLRFDALRAAGIRRVGLWSSPVPDLFWPFLKAL
jgi:hypothetical protein